MKHLLLGGAFDATPQMLDGFAETSSIGSSSTAMRIVLRRRDPGASSQGTGAASIEIVSRRGATRL